MKIKKKKDFFLGGLGGGGQGGCEWRSETFVKIKKKLGVGGWGLVGGQVGGRVGGQGECERRSEAGWGWGGVE